MNKKYKNKFFLIYGDLTDTNSISAIIKKIKPNEIYNLAAQSHVGVSFELPHYTTQVNAIGTLNILEAIRINGLQSITKFYQASTSELFGEIQDKNFIQRVLMQPLSYLDTG